MSSTTSFKNSSARTGTSGAFFFSSQGPQYMFSSLIILLLMSISGITNLASQLLVMPVRSPARGDIGPSALDEHWVTTHGWRRRLAISCGVSFPPLHMCIALIFLPFMFYSCCGQVSDGLAEFRWLGPVTGCVGGLLWKWGCGWMTQIFCLWYAFLVSGCRQCWYLRRTILCSRNTEGEYNLVCGMILRVADQV